MSAPILLTGGTGTLGSQVLPLLLAAGHPVRVLSRSQREDTPGVEYVTGDLGTGAGVDAAVAGVEIVVHCAGSAKGDDVKARTLAVAAARAGVRHLVNMSVAGADRVPVTGPVSRAVFGYFAQKLAAEKVVVRQRRAVDDAARHPVPRPGADGRPGSREVAGRAGAGRLAGAAG